MTENKMAGPNGPCENSDNLRRFLDERLGERHELLVTQHIGQCERCRSLLASLVAEDSEWDDLKENLSDFQMDEFTNEFAFSQQPSLYSEKQIVGLLAPTDDPEKLGRLGTYEVCGVIGAGSMGIVLKAFDPSLGRYVAIKMLAPALANSGLARKRFAREGRAIAAVRCAHVMQIHGVGEFSGTPYIVMQYLPGGSLQNRLNKQGDLTTREVCRIGMQVATGLAAAHQQGIVHRDIKPANVLLQDGLDCAIVSDFGLARVIDETNMTHTGSISGTPQFMSPEQAKGEPLDERTDLFSLGSVMYAACTGRSPFRGETLMGVVNRVCEGEPRKIREHNPDIDQWLTAFIEKLMAKDPNNRFSTANEVANLLRVELAYLQNPTNLVEPPRNWLTQATTHFWQRWSTRLVATGLVLAAMVGLGVYGVQGFDFFKTLLPGTTESHVTESSSAIPPTESQLSYFEAKSAYDLANETHLMERRLRGDMTESVERHGKALKLGFNRAQSSFYLARAYAYQGSINEAFYWLDAAFEAGFHDTDSLRTTPDLSRIREDTRYRSAVERCADLESKFRDGDKIYFRQKDYVSAEQKYRELLQTCPNSDLCTTMLAASLLLQEKLDEAAIWNERVRNTSQYASFGSYNLACIAALNSDSELAFAYLDHAVDFGFTDIEHLQQDEQLSTLRGMPEFAALIARMKRLQVTRNENQNRKVKTTLRGVWSP